MTGTGGGVAASGQPAEQAEGVTTGKADGGRARKASGYLGRLGCDRTPKLR